MNPTWGETLLSRRSQECAMMDYGAETLYGVDCCLGTATLDFSFKIEHEIARFGDALAKVVLYGSGTCKPKLVAGKSAWHSSSVESVSSRCTHGVEIGEFRFDAPNRWTWYSSAPIPLILCQFSSLFLCVFRETLEARVASSLGWAFDKPDPVVLELGYLRSVDRLGAWDWDADFLEVVPIRITHGYVFPRPISERDLAVQRERFRDWGGLFPFTGPAYKLVS